MSAASVLLGGTLDAQGHPATLGVMGGGQLGRMFVHAAQAMGYATAVLDPDPTSPAGRVADYHVQTPYLDEAGLAQLLQRSSAITIEFENVPAAALITLGSHRHVAPDGASVAVCQDRALEKQQFAAAGVPCAPHAVIVQAGDLERVDVKALLPGILKTARLGYDGKGQVVVDTIEDAGPTLTAFAAPRGGSPALGRPAGGRAALAAAWQQLGGVACVLEKKLDLALEISVVLARDAMGATVTLPVQQNLHRDGILAVTQSPAPDASDAIQAQAIDAARRIADAMRYVGVLCVEFFVVNGQVIANEMAPRPHNSGHHSIDSCDISQFELQVRTLAGLPLVAPQQHSAAVMLNLLGDLWFGADGREHSPPWERVLALPGAHLHLYGKTQARRGRKMGHLTVTAPDAQQAKARALEAAAILGLPAF
jgi:5-(carboxyamino)imidazole ribonucleotide synthase